jgi:AraC-like DNA-binding protein
MELAIHRPRPPLDAHVETMTYFAGLDVPHAREKLIPDGAIELIVDLSDRPKALYSGEAGPEASRFRHAWISGMQLRPLVIEVQPAASLFVIRFRPGGISAFLGHDAAALTDSVIQLDIALGATSLRDRVLEGRTAAEKFAGAERWLHERGHCRLVVDPAVRYLAMRLGQGRVRDLIEKTGYSERQVLNLFRRHVGLSPKQFARIQRFKRLLGALGGAEDPWLGAGPLPQQDWAGLAAAHGYVDQSHLVHEFRALAGMTPGAYAAAYGGLTNYLPIMGE